MEKIKEIAFMLIALVVIIVMGFDIRNPDDQKDIFMFVIYTIPIMLLLLYVKKLKYSKPNLFLTLIFLTLGLWSLLTFYVLHDLAILISMILGMGITLLVIFFSRITRNN
ncbi:MULTISPECIES: hypothetical protein [Bacillus cereus group]|uniref:Uncharacterized protein n=2 Tax=Bacillus cereus group TaxID=86661 RepID=R8QN39_BACCE|nr:MULTISPECIES: hypothetical protein [Bacillus cereus group]EOP72480.1 hypothetical protein IIQ_05847 [Bacillus cereus VD118]MBJ8095880.1 hypothetical protein [Bacillus cereus]CAH2464620.1 hypothetical protein ACOSJ1_EBGNOMHC_05155 [Bacillus mycoides KBAB4]SCB66799.1 Uncharacterized protein BWGO95_00912 [Bacillus mycoides]